MITRLVLAAFAAGCLGPSTALAAEKTLTADRVDVRLELARDGSVAVTENSVFRFEGGPFSSVVRQLPTNHTDGIVDIAAAVDGVPCLVGRQAGRVLIERENGVTVTWRFAGLSDTTRTLTLRYRVLGVMRRQADADVLFWRAIPSRRSYAVRATSAQVSWPKGGTLAGALQVTSGVIQVAEDGRSAYITGDQNLPPGTVLDITVRFAPGSVSPGMAAWQARQERGRAAAPPIAMGAGAILLAGFAWILVFWIGHRREPVDGVETVPRTMPPDEGLPVAMAAALLEPGATTNWSHALATLLALAGRGLVRVEELPGRTWQGSREYVIHATGRPTGLRAHEAALFDLLFSSKNGPVTSVKLSAVGRAAQSRLKPFKIAVGDELVTAGLASPERSQTKSALVRWALVLVVVAGAGFVGAAMLVPYFEGWPMLVPGAVMAVAVTILIMASQYSVLSTAGRLHGAAWRTFFSFVQQVARGRQPITNPAWFDTYLPFAVARGVGHQWVRRFEKTAGVQGSPSWWSVAPAPLGGRTPLGALADMLLRARAVGAVKHGSV